MTVNAAAATAGCGCVNVFTYSGGYVLSTLESDGNWFSDQFAFTDDKTAAADATTTTKQQQQMG
jgi:hypothetical protein